jgi:hypothetical protein
VNVAQHILVFGVRIYRWVISPAKTVLFGPLGRCRFTPSCSEYALDALRGHGALAGSWLALKRIGRCHPWGGCGHDPVPAYKSKVQSPKAKVSGRDSGVFSGLPLSTLRRQFHSQRH